MVLIPETGPLADFAFAKSAGFDRRFSGPVANPGTAISVRFTIPKDQRLCPVCLGIYQEFCVVFEGEPKSNWYKARDK
jgi:hypothetical protein